MCLTMLLQPTYRTNNSLKLHSNIQTLFSNNQNDLIQNMRLFWTVVGNKKIITTITITLVNIRFITKILS